MGVRLDPLQILNANIIRKDMTSRVTLKRFFYTQRAYNIYDSFILYDSKRQLNHSNAFIKCARFMNTAGDSRLHVSL
jgi:hypothetical protein